MFYLLIWVIYINKRIIRFIIFWKGNFSFSFYIFLYDFIYLEWWSKCYFGI